MQPTLDGTPPTSGKPLSVRVTAPVLLFADTCSKGVAIVCTAGEIPARRISANRNARAAEGMVDRNPMMELCVFGVCLGK